MINFCEQCGKKFYIKTHKRKKCYDCRPKLRFVNDQDIKMCIGGCNRSLPNTTEFYRQQKKGLHPWCRECINRKQNESKRLIKLKALSIYGSSECSLCGYKKNVAALSFHHLDPKDKDNTVPKTSKSKLSNEISKCILVCERCHVEIHAGLHPKILIKKYVDNYHANTQRKRVQGCKIERVKYLGGCCSKCGYNKCIASLNFHHKNISSKAFGISQKTDMALEDIKSELDKCILLCDNCHEEEHHPLDPQT